MQPSNNGNIYRGFLARAAIDINFAKKPACFWNLTFMWVLSAVRGS
jgi:hypothetical protein